MDIKTPQRLSPSFKNYLWGGRRLVTDFKKNCDFDTVAESWELSTHKDGSSIISGGELDGMAFRDYIAQYKEQVLGANALAFDYFPILIKFIDAKDKLSIQVHPNDEYALKNEGEYGKTEMWYVLDCEPDAWLYYGFKQDITREEFIERIKNNTITEVLNRVSVKKGDVFFVEAGTIHAIGSGTLICEIQQNSNTTYRVYDFDRRDKFGNARELHVEKAAEVTAFTAVRNTSQALGNEMLAQCKYFTVKKADINGERRFATDDLCFTSVIVADGEGTLKMNGNCFTLRKGDSIFIPAQNGEYTVSGQCELIISRV